MIKELNDEVFPFDCPGVLGQLYVKHDFRIISRLAFQRFQIFKGKFWENSYSKHSRKP